MLAKYIHHLTYPPFASSQGFLWLAWLGWFYRQPDIFIVNHLIWISSMGNHAWRSLHKGWWLTDVLLVHCSGCYYMVYSILNLPFYPYVFAECAFAIAIQAWFHLYSRKPYSKDWGQSVIHGLAICGQTAYILAYYNAHYLQ